MPITQAQARGSAHRFQVAGCREDDPAEHAVIVDEPMCGGTETGFKDDILQRWRVDESLGQRMESRGSLRLPGTLDFSVHEVSLTLERIERQTHLLSWIITIESDPIDIYAVYVKLTEAGQQFRPIVSSRPHRIQPESTFRVYAAT